MDKASSTGKAGTDGLFACRNGRVHVCAWGGGRAPCQRIPPHGHAPPPPGVLKGNKRQQDVRERAHTSTLKKWHCGNAERSQASNDMQE
eukprot:scaffold49719_cov23-Tisochrysis_lutea.AAC.1